MIINRRKIIFCIIAVLLIIFAVSTVKTYLFEGQLVIGAPAGAQISISSTSDTEFKPAGKSVHLSPGLYIIRVQKDNTETRAAAQIVRRHTVSMDISLRPVKNAVISIPDVAASRIKASSDGSITFLSSAFRQLFTSSPGSLRSSPYLPDIYPVTQADWLDNGGLVVSTGTSFSSYIDSAGAGHDLGVNLSIQGSNYSVSPSGQIAYMSSDQKLMYASAPTAPPVNLPAPIVNGAYSLRVSDDGKYIFLYSSYNGADAAGKTSLTNFIVDTALPQNPLKFNTSHEIDDVSWSTNSKTAVFSTGPSLTLIDAASGRQKTIPTSPRALPAWLLGWLDSSHLLYAQDSIIWSLDTDSLTSYKLTSYQGSLTPSSFYKLSGTKVYYSTQSALRGQGSGIYELDL